jgi:hypothetical protein
MLLMKDDLFALCEERGRKVTELADLLAKQLGRHPRSPEILEEVETAPRQLGRRDASRVAA